MKAGISMITVKCTYADGDTITTRFNGTPEDARKYFVGNTFNIGSVEDNNQKCLSIEVLAGPETHGKFAIKVDGEEIDHADTPAEAQRNRDTIIYGEIGTEANTTIETKPVGRTGVLWHSSRATEPEANTTAEPKHAPMCTGAHAPGEGCTR
jgi:hypothetical protein